MLPVRPSSRFQPSRSSAAGVVLLQEDAVVTVGYEPKPARYYIDVGITQDPTWIHDRASGETFVSWGNLVELVEDVRGVLDRFGPDSRWAPGVDVDAVGNGFGLWQLLLKEGIEAHRAPTPIVLRGREARFPA